jgi:hypothetical protein
MSLSRDEILAKKGGKVVEVTVPEWGGTVHLREMTAAERDAFEQASLDKSGTARLINIRARLASISICDESGKRLFSDSDIHLLGELPASALDRIFDASMRLNKISKADVDELEKN